MGDSPHQFSLFPKGRRNPGALGPFCRSTLPFFSQVAFPWVHCDLMFFSCCKGGRRARTCPETHCVPGPALSSICVGNLIWHHRNPMGLVTRKGSESQDESHDAYEATQLRQTASWPMACVACASCAKLQAGVYLHTLPAHLPSPLLGFSLPSHEQNS